MYNNPMLQQLSRASNGVKNLSQIKNLVQQVQQAPNQQAFVLNLLNQNPNYQAAMNLIKNCGNNPQQAFYNLANQMGVNPEEFLNQLGIQS